MTEPITREEYQLNNKNIMQEIKELKKDINDIKVELAGLPERILERLDEKYVSKDVFAPIQKIVYGLVGAILLGVIGAARVD